MEPLVSEKGSGRPKPEINIAEIAGGKLPVNIRLQFPFPETKTIDEVDARQDCKNNCWYKNDGNSYPGVIHSSVINNVTSY